MTKVGAAYDKADTLTTTVPVYGAPLAMWMNEVFGAWFERIPDEVFTWGEDFCRGLLCGLLCGDGSKTVSYSKNHGTRSFAPRQTRNGKAWGRPPSHNENIGTAYPISKVDASGIRASLTLQARDLASLGYGWAAVSRKARANAVETLQRAVVGDVVWRSKRGNCAPSWDSPELPTGRASGNRYRIEDGAVWLKIRKIENGIRADEIWDLSVLHADHAHPLHVDRQHRVGSLGRPQGLRDPDGHLGAGEPEPALPVQESAPLGFNLFWDCWKRRSPTRRSRAGHRSSAWDRAKEPYVLAEVTPDFERWWGAYPAYTEYEQQVTQEVFAEHGVEITPEQWAWYRAKADEALGAEHEGRVPRAGVRGLPGSRRSSVLQPTAHHR